MVVPHSVGGNRRCKEDAWMAIMQIEEKKIQDSPEVPSDPEESESLYPPISDDTANAG